jgi:hypothetical protein
MPLVTEKVEVPEFNLIHRVTLRYLKRRLDGFEFLESMHLSSSAGELVLTSDVSLTTPMVSPNHFICLGIM